MKKVALFFIVIVIGLNIFAQKVASVEMEQVLASYKNRQATKSLKIYSQKRGTETANVFYNDNFFVVISADKHFSPVIAYSKTNGIDDLHVEKFTSFVQSIYEKQEQKLSDYPETALKHQKEWTKILDSKHTRGTISYGPIIQSLYGQVNCKDENGNTINVTNIYTPENVAVGCVAVSLTTVLHHFGWPHQAMRKHSYYDGYGNNQGTHIVNFNESFYRWNDIENRYHNRERTHQERQALGQLAYESAVSIKMDFENGGSTSNVSRIPEALASHFRFTSNYSSIGFVNFWQKTESNIVAGLPVIFAVKADNGWGHSVVCSGWKTDDNDTKYYHLNMGWWGSANGWYQLRDEFNAGGYTSVTAGVFDITPEVQLYEPLYTSGSKINLKWLYPEFPKFDSYELQMKRDNFDWIPLNSQLTDNSFLMTLNGYSTYSFRVRTQKTDEIISWNWSNIVTFSDYISSIDGEAIPTFNCYPNPAHDLIYIDFDKPLTSACFIEIFNSTGSLVMSDIKSLDKKIAINVKYLPEDLYIVRLRMNKQSFTHSFLKKN